MAASFSVEDSSRAMKRTRTPSPSGTALSSEMAGGVWSMMKGAVRQVLVRATLKAAVGASEAVTSRR